MLFCGLAARSLPCPRPRELNQGISSLDSFPFSHSNFGSHASPHPAGTKGPVGAGASRAFLLVWLWPFFVSWQKTLQLEVVLFTSGPGPPAEQG